MSMQKALNELKRLASNPQKQYLLQDVELLKRELDIPHTDLNKAMRFLSKQDRKLAETHVIYPFVMLFGRFCKQHISVKKHPNISEIRSYAQIKYADFIDKGVLHHTTSNYMLKKMIGTDPDWSKQLTSKSGAPKANWYLKEENECLTEFNNFLRNNVYSRDIVCVNIDNLITLIENTLMDIDDMNVKTLILKVQQLIVKENL